MKEAVAPSEDATAFSVDLLFVILPIMGMLEIIAHGI